MLLWPATVASIVPWTQKYQSFSSLDNASVVIVVANVTSARTVGVSVSESISGGSNDNPVPMTFYNITVVQEIKNEFGPAYASAGASLVYGEIGGTIPSSSMNVTGYPLLSLGS
jgi:hypothetical protein